MIDSVNSLAAALTALTGTIPSGERSSGDPAFMQILEAIAGPNAGGTSGTALEAALKAAAGNIFPEGNLAQGLLLLTQGDGMPDQGCNSIESKTDQDNPEAGLEMLLALLSAAASQLQLWQNQAQDAGKIETAEGGRDPEGAADRITAVPGTVAPSIQSQVVGLLRPTGDDGPAVAGGSPASIEVEHRPYAPEAPFVVTPVVADVVSHAPLAARPPAVGAADSLIDGYFATGKDARQLEDSKAAPGEQQPKLERAPDQSAALHALLRTHGASGDLQDVAVLPEHEGATVREMSGPGKAGKAAATAQELSGQTDGSHSLSPVLGDKLTIGGPDAGEPGSQDETFNRDTPSDTFVPVNGLRRDSAVASAAFQPTAPDGTGAALPGASVVEQIARRAHLILSRGRSGLNIQLEPKELGKIRVYVGLGSGGVHVKLEAEASDTRGMLQASLPHLKLALESQGLRVDRFDLALGSGSSGFGSPQDDSQQQPRLSGGQTPLHYDWADDATLDSSINSETSTSNSLVDYRI